MLGARNPEVQMLRRLLRRRSAREEAGRYVIEGPRLVVEALDAGVELDAVYVPADVSDADAAALLAACAARATAVRRLAPGVLEGAASTVTPQPALAVARPRPASLPDAVRAGAAPLVLVLCDVADPGNAGTLLRVAEAAGAAAVVACGAAAVDLYNPKVVRAAAGSLFRVATIAHEEPAAVLDELGRLGVQRVATAVDRGVPYDHADLRGPTALVLGNEAHGLAPAVVERLDLVVTIPMHGAVESLNVAIAGAVLAFEAARQRRTEANR